VKPGDKRWVVIAWTETVWRYEGRPFAADLGALPGMVEVTEGRACVWLRDGTEVDVEEARAYLDKTHPDGWVICYPRTEKEPLIRARAEILAS